MFRSLSRTLLETDSEPWRCVQLRIASMGGKSRNDARSKLRVHTSGSSTGASTPETRGPNTMGLGAMPSSVKLAAGVVIALWIVVFAEYNTSNTSLISEPQM